MEPEGIKLAHYTRGPGLIGVIENQELWATNISYLNDSREFVIAYAHAIMLLEGDEFATKRAEDARLFQEIREWMDPLLLTQLPSVFVISFTRREDDLSQWRGYTSPGDGYALLFDGHPLARLAGSRKWHLSPCQYGPGGVMLIRNMLTNVIDRYETERDEGTDDPAGWAAFFARSMHNMAPTVKDAAFRDEQEWRLVSPPLGLPDTKTYFRASRSFLAPYVKFSLEGLMSDILQGVIVGPGPSIDLAKSAATDLLLQHKLNFTAVKSAVPYRPW